MRFPSHALPLLLASLLASCNVGAGGSATDCAKDSTVFDSPLVVQTWKSSYPQPMSLAEAGALLHRQLPPALDEGQLENLSNELMDKGLVRRATPSRLYKRTACAGDSG